MATSVWCSRLITPGTFHVQTQAAHQSPAQPWSSAVSEHHCESHLAFMHLHPVQAKDLLNPNPSPAPEIPERMAGPRTGPTLPANTDPLTTTTEGSGAGLTPDSNTQTPQKTDTAQVHPSVPLWTMWTFLRRGCTALGQQT